MARDLKLGRMQRDSISLRVDSMVTDTFFIQNFRQALAQKNIRGSLEQLEPKLKGYTDLKAAIPAFLDSADLKKITYVYYLSLIHI